MLSSGHFSHLGVYEQRHILVFCLCGGRVQHTSEHAVRAVVCLIARQVMNQVIQGCRQTEKHKVPRL